MGRMTSTVERWPGRDGNPLAVELWGDPDAPGVVLLHGGGQTRHAWGGTARALAAAGWFAVAVDQRGHGDSAWDPDADYSLEAFKQDLLTVLAHFDSPPAVVGASLGGLAGMLAQGETESRLMSALVLVDIAHRLERAGVVRVLSFMGEHAQNGFASVEEAGEFVARYLPHRKRPRDLSGLRKNLRLREDGRYRWHWDPAFLNGRPTAPEVIIARLRSAAEGLTEPTLLVRGRMSDVLSMETAEEFVQLVPGAVFVDVAEAAHMVAGDRNDVFSEAVSDFLADVHGRETQSVRT
jgi:pimeloyl-ACP methyl ester carboxylesterase